MNDGSRISERTGRTRERERCSRRHSCRRALRSTLWTAALATLLLPVARVRAQGGPSLVSVAPVVQREVKAGRTFVGTVVARRKSTVGSAVDGRVIEFPVNEGQRVKAGDVLAQLLTETLEIQISGAKAELSLRQEELAELENGSRPEEIQQAKARMLHSEAAKTYWQIKRDRSRDLFKKGQSISQEELEETESSAEQAIQAFEEAKAAWELTVAGPRPERIAQARARMLTQQEEVRRLEDMLAKHTIRARFDGYVVAEYTEVGAWLSQGDPVVDVVDLDEVDVEVPVLEDYVSNLEIGMETRVELGALRERAFTGHVVQIVPQADVRARTFPVKVRVPNEQRGGTVLLKAGMFARVTLPLGRVEQAVLVPKDALVLGGRSPSVYVVDADAKNPKQGTVRPVEVELGVADGDLIQVKSQGGLQGGPGRAPLAAGAQVVVRGNERLRPGEVVTIAEVLPTERPSAPKTGTAPAGAAAGR